MNLELNVLRVVFWTWSTATEEYCCQMPLITDMAYSLENNLFSRADRLFIKCRKEQFQPEINRLINEVEYFHRVSCFCVVSSPTMKIEQAHSIQVHHMDFNPKKQHLIVCLSSYSLSVAYSTCFWRASQALLLEARQSINCTLLALFWMYIHGYLVIVSFLWVVRE